MKMRLILAGLIATSSLFAQEKQEKKDKKELVAQIAGHLASPQKRSTVALKPAATTLSSVTVYEAFTGLVIPGGQNLNLTSAQDWTGADHVSIAIECPGSTNLKNIALVVYWAIPIVNFYTLTDIIEGSNFLFTNQGGAVVPTYGNQLQVTVVNQGSNTIACDQLTIYAIAH